MTTVQAIAPTSRLFTPARAAALGALGFAAGVAVQNFLLLVGMPDASAPAAEAATWLADNTGRATTSSTLVGINLPLLLLFAAALRALVRDVQAARIWVDLGASAVIVLAALFGVVAATQIAAALIAGAGATPAFTALWSLHNAAFAVLMTALGTTLLGFAVGAHAAGLTPAWQRYVGVIGAALLLITGLANATVAGGSPIVNVGLAGFALWLLWLVAIGVRLIGNPAGR